MNRIKELRKTKKMTQKELAKHLQIADSTLSYWEMGRYEPDHESLKKLSRFFNVTIDYLFGDDVTKQESNEINVHYTDRDKSFSVKNDSGVGESKVQYEDKTTTVGSKGFGMTMFEREEFVGLTNDETEKLVEYARFIKSLREA